MLLWMKCSVLIDSIKYLSLLLPWEDLVTPVSPFVFLSCLHINKSITYLSLGRKASPTSWSLVRFSAQRYRRWTQKHEHQTNVNLDSIKS